MDTDSIWIVAFYVPWCDHCKAFAPHLEAAAHDLMDKGYKVTLGAVDVSVNKQLGLKYEINKSPYVKIFFHDDDQWIDTDYLGEATQEAIQDFAKEFYRDSNVLYSDLPEDFIDGEMVYLDDSNFDDVISNSNEIWILKFSAPWCPHCQALKPSWINAAKELGADVRFAIINADANRGLAKRFDVRMLPTLKFYNAGYGKNDDNVRNYESGRSQNEIITFARDLRAEYDANTEQYAYNSDVDFDSFDLTAQNADSDLQDLIDQNPNIVFEDLDSIANLLVDDYQEIVDEPVAEEHDDSHGGGCSLSFDDDPVEEEEDDHAGGCSLDFGAEEEEPVFDFSYDHLDDAYFAGEDLDLDLDTVHDDDFGDMEVSCTLDVEDDVHGESCTLSGGAADEFDFDFDEGFDFGFDDFFGEGEDSYDPFAEMDLTVEDDLEEEEGCGLEGLDDGHVHEEGEDHDHADEDENLDDLEPVVLDESFVLSDDVEFVMAEEEVQVVDENHHDDHEEMEGGGCGIPAFEELEKLEFDIESICTEGSLCIVAFLDKSVESEDKKLDLKDAANNWKELDVKFFWIDEGDNEACEDKLTSGNGITDENRVIGFTPGQTTFVTMSSEWTPENLDKFVEGLVGNEFEWANHNEQPEHGIQLLEKTAEDEAKAEAEVEAEATEEVQVADA